MLKATHYLQSFVLLMLVMIANPASAGIVEPVEGETTMVRVGDTIKIYGPGPSTGYQCSLDIIEKRTKLVSKKVVGGNLPGSDKTVFTLKATSRGMEKLVLNMESPGGDIEYEQYPLRITN
ncbi:hypothetical protein [Calycomorphotria hydatis]|uniref:Chagasin family peptidase inhibitor I42 n=1 Tax=Calycomorphotria hydatis TaxID=2528027 RepID=A0A517T918_9PLAN|nr:hypothetical protein [Calycomorphotria hydatis]QDT64875.1 hypothetical protein V22_21180 [Calycomorphotria hydatis]